MQKSFIRKNPVVRHDNVNHHQDNTRDQMCEHFIGSQLVVMVLRAQWPLGTIAQFFHFVAEEKKKKKKKDDKKTKAFYDLATTGIPVIKIQIVNFLQKLPQNVQS